MEMRTWVPSAQIGVYETLHGELISIWNRNRNGFFCICLFHTRLLIPVGLYGRRYQ